MKTLVAVFTVLGFLSVSTSAWASCGTNTSRNSNTARSPSSGTTTPGSGTTDTAAGAGTPR